MTDAERLYELLYSCESRDEMCERVVRMEALVRELWPRAALTMNDASRASLMGRIAELGIEVGVE